jgi:hypothetical protein
MTGRKPVDRFVRPLPALLLLLAATPAVAQEHPEHPEKTEEKPAGEPVTLDALAVAITRYVESRAAETGGKFVVEDAVLGAKLELTLERVHRERLSRVGRDTYFACADFRAADGTLYDLDVFMKGRAADRLKTTEVSIHKRDGKERYTWYEEGGVWKKRPVS